MKWAIAKGFRPDNPAGDAISAALPRNGGPKHYRALPHGEVGSALARMSVSAGGPGPRLAIEFLVLTAARSAEVRGARWGEIDLDAATWEIPGERMKTGKPHRVPLSGRALEVLKEARKRFGDSDLVFRSARGKAVTNAVLLRVLRRCDVGGTVHGFRTSFRSWAAEEGVDRQSRGNGARACRQGCGGGLPAQRPAGETESRHAGVGRLRAGRTRPSGVGGTVPVESFRTGGPWSRTLPGRSSTLRLAHVANKRVGGVHAHGSVRPAPAGVMEGRRATRSASVEILRTGST